MTTRQALLKLNKILYKLCINVEFKDDIEVVEYIPHKNGATINVDFPTYKDYLSGGTNIDIDLIKVLAHELGHYLVAPPKRRRQKDYGVKNKNSKYSIKVNDKYELEEIKAQAIEFEICERVGFKPQSRLDWRKRIDGNYDITKWWQSEGKQLVDNMFYILGI